MKEILFSPQIIDQEKKRLEEESDLTEAKILQSLIEVYGSKSVANYLDWYGEQLIKEENERNTI